MPKIKEFQYGRVFLREMGPRRWRASWVDPLTKKHVRRLLPATSFKDAAEQVDEINKALGEGRGFGGRLRGKAGHTVADAGAEAVNHTHANPRTRADYLSRFNAFTKYLRENCAGIEAWKAVNEAILENFIQNSRGEKISHDTLKSRLFVIRLTGAYMARTYGQRNPAAGIRLRRLDPPKAELEAKDSILGPATLRAVLTRLEATEPMIHVWAVLQGLCGLRMLEAAYLREQDFDPAQLTLTITESSAHKPKNRPSYRTIPVCAEAGRVLSAWIAGLKVRHAEGFIFMPTRAIEGRPHAKSEEARVGVITRDRISHLWCSAMEGLAREPDEARRITIPSAFQPRKLRASFVTALREAGADFEVLQRYIGHAPSSILGAHYDKVDLSRLRSIPTLAEGAFSGSAASPEEAFSRI